MTTRALHYRTRHLRLDAARRAFTFTEFLVALIVFGVALSGLLPLVAILSRELQPWRPSTASAYKCSSPARDGNGTGADLAYERHTWYLTPSSDAWMRKLGASAQLTAGTATTTALTSMQPPVVFLNDSDPSGTYVNDDTNGAGTFTYIGAGWLTGGSFGYKSNYHYHEAPTDSNDPALTDTARWTLTIPADGWYSIQATWPLGTGRTLTAASFQVSATGHGSISVPVVQNTPGNGIADTVAVGVTWWPLTTPKLLHLAQGDTVVVTLNVPLATVPNTFVIADAVRIVQNEVSVVSVERAVDGQNHNSQNAAVTANVSVNVNVPQ
jgi:prepilin-type N-terminal cleavage/methylation domain-containing protein